MSYFDYDEERNRFDFRTGNHWQKTEVIADDNLIETKAYSFEKAIDFTKVHVWYQNYWHYSVYFSIIYFVLVFGGQAYMKDRPRYTLQKPLIAWNIFLATFSIFGTIRIWSVMYDVYKLHGFIGTVCDSEYFYSPVSCFWSMLFIMSKLPELVDTAFIVLRKQKLIFLHWYHHITVMIYSWYTFRDRLSGSQWYISMNFFVHALMYSYYACRAMKIKIPKPIAVTITFLQLSQMFVGVAVQFYIYWKRHDPYCPTHFYNIRAAVIMYGSYYVLFAKFFYDAYIAPKFKKPASKKE